MAEKSIELQRYDGRKKVWVLDAFERTYNPYMLVKDAAALKPGTAYRAVDAVTNEVVVKPFAYTNKGGVTLTGI